MEHIQDFWGDPLTAAGSQSNDGKAALVQVYLAGNQGESLSNESVDSVRNIVDHTPPPPGVKAYVTGAAPLVTDQFEVGRHGTLKTTLITIGVIALMLFSLYRRLTTVFLVIFTVMIELTASRGVVAVLANAGIIKLSTYSTNLLTLAGHRRRNRLCDLHSRPFSRSALRRAGSRFGVQHDVPRNRAHHLGFGPDDCRRGVVSDLHPAPVFPEPWHSRRNRRPCRSGGGVDPGAGLTGHRSPFRSVRTQPADAHPGLAAHRHGHRPLARTHPGGDDRRGPHRSARPTEIHDELRRPPLHARQCPGQCRLRGRGTPLFAGAAESRTVDDRSRPRSTKFHRHDPAGARRQGGFPHRRHRSGAVDHPAAGHAVGPHVDTVPDQRGERVSDQQSALSAGPRRRPAQTGRRDQQLDRRPATAVCAATTVQRRHRRADQGIPADGRHGPRPARQDRKLRRLLPAAAQLLLLGAALFRHPGLRRAAIALRRSRRDRRADRPTCQCLGEHRQAG